MINIASELALSGGLPVIWIAATKERLLRDVIYVRGSLSMDFVDFKWVPSYRRLYGDGWEVFFLTRQSRIEGIRSKLLVLSGEFTESFEQQARMIVMMDQGRILRT